MNGKYFTFENEMQPECKFNLLDGCFVWVEALHSSQQFFSHVKTFSWVEPVLCNKDEVSCSRTQYRDPGEIGTRVLAIKSPALYRANDDPLKRMQ